MGNDKNRAILQEHLRSGENVLWHGWAEPCKFLEGKDKTRIIKNWIIACVVFGAFLVFYMSAADVLNYKFMIGTLLILAPILCMPYMEWLKLRDQQYWVTDQRVITCRKSAFCGVDMELVDAVDVKKLSTGNDCVLLCSKIVAEGEKQLRWRSSSPIDGNVPGEVGMLFYNVARAQEAVDAIRSVKGDI